MEVKRKLYVNWSSPEVGHVKGILDGVRETEWTRIMGQARMCSWQNQTLA